MRERAGLIKLDQVIKLVKLAQSHKQKHKQGPHNPPGIIQKPGTAEGRQRACKSKRAVAAEHALFQAAHTHPGQQTIPASCRNPASRQPHSR
jgi:hypothetical protein